ncbi:PREDICTED: cilia- and flagella-associated protein 74-like isoform X2 [Amphimedon queenslandica]|uniref:Uncharacterized protein n=1 Tax=Amphimedon queenslandica TaxID=400682 RepID=A0A1X7UUI2_AMPQE|nr:PREDICTED: cilia- and flagella-associated protein 74-like isoform X2 [Amphimedon queenslandica]|eukprot:XP_019852101.1 PREDICTED: cilia- and flagella-associated protein 74-like isoform X2 [Amphimedon queenslandica]
MDEIIEGYQDLSSQEDLNSEGFDQSITTTSSSSSENELGGGLSDEYEDYEEREEESVPLNTNSYFEDDSGSITDPPKSSSVNVKKQQKLNRKEVKEFYKLSSNMAQMNDNLEEKQAELHQAMKKLSQCRESARKLKTECYQIESGLLLEEESPEQTKPLNDSGLAKQQLEKTRKELSVKQCHEDDLKIKISQLELDLLEAQLLQSTECSDPSSFYQQQKMIIQQHKHKQGLLRVQTQTREVIEAQRRDLKDERDKRHRKVAAIKTVQSTQKGEKLQQHLREKSAKLRIERAANEEIELEDRKTRIKALLSLKKNIESSQESMRAHQSLLKEKEKTKLKEEEEEKSKLAMEMRGEDPTVIILKRKRLEQLSKEKQIFEQKIKRRQAEIISQLLDETKRLSKQSQQQEHQDLAQKKDRATTKKTGIKLETSDENEEDGLVTVTESNEENVPADETGSDTSIKKLPSKDMAMKKTLLQPDIPGLWEPKSEQKLAKQIKRSKMEQSIMEKRLTKLKESVISTQVAAGKVFKGEHSFLSKPEEIIFKDFDVGKVYKKKVQLTNVSYSISHVKLLGASDNLKNFVQIEFTPPGAMSAGITCPLLITFEPKVNEDIIGSVDFMSQTGPFSINVKCLIKRCLVVVNKSEIEFGPICIGETIKRSVTVHNNGALPTDFTFLPLSETGVSGDTKQASDLTDKEEAPLSVESQRSILSTVEYASDQKMLLKMGRALDDKQHAHSLVDINSISSVNTKTKLVKPGRASAKKSEQEKGNDTNATEDAVESKEDKDNLVDDPVTLAVSEESLDNGEKVNDVSPITISEGIRSGMIDPYSSVVLDLVFCPKISGSYQSQFVLSTTNEPIHIVATGEAIDLPIYTEREVIDLDICMTDLLYQDSVVLCNRSRTALQATFSIPSLVSDHMEIIPKYGLVQGGSSFTAQLKFLPRPSLLTEESSELFEGGTLKVPISIIVAGQSSPVTFTVMATVTESDISLSQTTLDFGQCTIHESVYTSIQLTNKSCLPQDFGFVHLPKWLSVQPNDGFGTLLPHETLSVDVIFTPDVPKEYFTNTVSCLTVINKEYKLTVKGTGIHTPLRLSHSTVLFNDTPLNTISVSRISILNPSTPSAHNAVTKGPTPLKASRLFEFHIPSENLPISVSPAVGIVDPGKSIDIEISFSPKLDQQSIKDRSIALAKKDAAAIAAKKAEEDRLASAEEEKQSKSSKSKGRRTTGRPTSQASNRSSLCSDSALMSGSQQKIEQTNNNKGEACEVSNSEISRFWWKAYDQLLHEYECAQYRCMIPCFISNPQTKITDHPGIIEYRPEEILYVDVSATAIKPSLFLVSNDGCATIDFGDVGVGSYCKKTVVLKNMSIEKLKVTATSMRSGFEIRNSLREIPSNSTHSMILQFEPETSGKYYETLKLRYGTSSYLELTLLGQGIEPIVHVTPEEGPVDWGYISAGDTISKSIQVKNTSEVKVELCLKMEADESSSRNCNGQPAFTCVPYSDVIPPNSTLTVNIQFSHDRPDCVYSENLHIEINDKKISSLALRGQSISGNMYATGGVTIGPNDVSMAAVHTTDTTSGSGTLTSHPLLFIFQYKSTDSVSQQLLIGSAKTSIAKKSKGEFTIETLQGNPIDTKCFTIDPMKSSLDTGEIKDIKITFHPRKDSMGATIKAQTNIILKGDVTMQHQLFLQAMPVISQD